MKTLKKALDEMDRNDAEDTSYPIAAEGFRQREEREAKLKNLEVKGVKNKDGLLPSVTISNYKVIDKLNIEDLEQINIFVGKNGCGKTSILEAIQKHNDPRVIFINDLGDMMYPSHKAEEFTPYLKLLDNEIEKVMIKDVEYGTDLVPTNYYGYAKLKGYNIPFYMENLDKKVLRWYNIFSALSTNTIDEPYIVCIDEFENGLHFETMRIFFRYMIQLVRDKKIQIFTTSHSFDTMLTICEIAREEKYEKVAVFNIAHTKLDGLQSYKYNMKSIQHAIDTETEFRD